MGAERQAHGDAGRAERDLRRPESDARASERQGQRDLARDPGREVERDAGRQRSEHLGESESDVDSAERQVDDPDRAAKDRVKKLDDD